MAEGKSPLDGILEESSGAEQEAKPLAQAVTNHKPPTSDEAGQSIGAPDLKIRQIRDAQASDSKYLAERLKQLEAMVMALRMLVGATALAAAYSIWKVRKIESVLLPNSPKKLRRKEAVIEVETSSPPTLQEYEAPSMES
jgi:hypothetical protein